MVAVMAAATLGYAAPRVDAAPIASGARSMIAMDMVLLIPEGHRLAIFDQVALDHPVSRVVMGMFVGAKDVKGIGASIVSHGSDAAIVEPQGARFAVRYSVPWNGRSASLLLPTVLPIKGLLVLIPARMALPPILNPSLASVGQGRIPDVADSPVFKEYATGNVAQGQSVPVVLERYAVNAAIPLSSASGNYPRVAMLFKLLIGLLGMGALAWALNWRVGVPGDARRGQRERYLRDMAGLKAAYQRGELEEGAFEREYRELLKVLHGVWDAPHG